MPQFTRTTLQHKSIETHAARNILIKYVKQIYIIFVKQSRLSAQTAMILLY